MKKSHEVHKVLIFLDHICIFREKFSSNKMEVDEDGEEVDQDIELDPT